MILFGFEKLDIWKLGRKFTKDIYRISKSFPGNKKFDLTSQIRSASISITSNIAERTETYIEELANKLNSLRKYQLSR